MKLRLQQLKIPLEYNAALLRQRAARILGCDAGKIESLVPVRRSLDSRQHAREAPSYVFTVDVEIPDAVVPKVLPRDVGPVPPPAEPSRRLASRPANRPVVVGSGPAGLLAALTLAEGGACPLLIERGAPADLRSRQVRAFWDEGLLDPESNVLYGEGGAGLFSDGKLMARTKDRGRMQRVFAAFVAAGADPDIQVEAEPHLGTDHLLELIPRMRQRILDLGGEIRFNARLEALEVEDGRLRGLVVNGQTMAADHCVLATGHSAGDVHELLARARVRLEMKAMAIGVRLELPQRRVDVAQFGRYAGDPRLGAASFRVTWAPEVSGLRSVHSFCMCPGGEVIACASDPGALTTNGMSYAARGGPCANAAFLVPVGPEDYGPAESAGDILAGIRYQRQWERRAFQAGGGRYAMPAQRLADFLKGRRSADLPPVRSGGRAVPGELNALLPSIVAESLRSALPAMVKELGNPDLGEVLLYGIETRSSSPVRIVRGDDLQSLSTRGLYPCGEGAGYAGGITSSAIDGLKAAEAILSALP